MDKDEMELLTLANNVLSFPKYYSDIAVTLAQGIVDLLSKEQQQYEEIKKIKAEVKEYRENTLEICNGVIKKFMDERLPELVEAAVMVKGCEEAQQIIEEL